MKEWSAARRRRCKVRFSVDLTGVCKRREARDWAELGFWLFSYCGCIVRSGGRRDILDGYYIPTIR